MSRTRLYCCVLAAASAAGCGDDAEPVVVSCTPPVLECPANPPELGVSGGFAIETAELEWQYCDEGNFSFAPFVYVAVPDDIVSLSMTVDQGEVNTGFAHVQIDDAVVVDDESAGAGPFAHEPLTAVASTIVLPMDMNTAPAGGCMAISAVAQGDVRSTPGKLHIATRRGGASGLLDINLVVVDGAGIVEADLNEAVTRMAELYVGAGAPDINDIRLYTTAASPSIIGEAGADLYALRAQETGGDPTYMNIFFVEDFLEPGTLGFAAGIPGPVAHGTAGSGVVISVDSHRDELGDINTALLGETLAHEVGHQFGLFHTSEADASSHDFLDDTPECTLAADGNADGELSATECRALDGEHMMFWIADDFSQPVISQTQSNLILASPIVR